MKLLNCLKLAKRDGLLFQWNNQFGKNIYIYEYLVKLKKMEISKDIIEITKMGEIRRIIILGHSGFIGSHIGKYYREQYPEVEILGCSFPALDLTSMDDVSTLKEFFGMNTAVVMLSMLKKEHGDNSDNFLKNIQMVINLCKVMEERPVKSFVYFSSAAVYGEDIHNTHITEETQIQPTSYYGVAKYTNERLLYKIINPQENSKLIILRPTVIYGPGDQPCYGPSGFVKAALENKNLTLWGDGNELRDFVFINDVVKLIHELIFRSYDGVLNISSGKSYSFVDILNIVNSLTKSKININSRDRTKDKVDHRFCNDKLLELFPEFTFTPIKEGIQKTIDFMSPQEFRGDI